MIETDMLIQSLHQIEPKIDPDHVKLLNRGGWGNGDVFQVRIDNREIVIKTYAFQSLIERKVGRLLINREIRAYRVLTGMKGIPPLLDIADKHSMAMEYISSQRISNQLLSEHGKQIIPRLRQLISSMHARGVFHLDLRNQGNIMIDPEYQPFILDFASAIVIKKPSVLNKPLRTFCERYDQYGLSKWEAKAGF